MAVCSKKIKIQLGMSPSVAYHKLRTDILFNFAIKEGHRCYHCDKELTRETFSIEHKIPWLDSEFAVDLYFNLENIAFSHFICNSRSTRRNKNK